MVFKWTILMVYSNGILRRVGNVQDERQAAIRGGLAKGETFWDQYV